MLRLTLASFLGAFTIADGRANRIPRRVLEHQGIATASTLRAAITTTLPSSSSTSPRFRRNDDAACLSNADAYIGEDCCAGTCGTNFYGCYECLTTPQQDPVNYGGPTCFREGSCLAQQSEQSCPPPSRLQFNQQDGAQYAGWCLCPQGTFCQGDGCNGNATSTTETPAPRDRFNKDDVSRQCSRRRM